MFRQIITVIQTQTVQIQMDLSNVNVTMDILEMEHFVLVRFFSYLSVLFAAANIKQDYYIKFKVITEQS